MYTAVRKRNAVDIFCCCCCCCCCCRLLLLLLLLLLLRAMGRYISLTSHTLQSSCLQHIRGGIARFDPPTRYLPTIRGFLFFHQSSDAVALFSFFHMKIITHSGTTRSTLFPLPFSLCQVIHVLATSALPAPSRQLEHNSSSTCASFAFSPFFDFKHSVNIKSVLVLIRIHRRSLYLRKHAEYEYN